ncbi:MAG: DnaJ domain-containing protein [Polyangiaceae bacterium]
MKGDFSEAKLRELSLAAVDRFVLSLVDGATSAKALADTVGLSTEEVLASLLKLESMQVIVLPASRPAQGGPPPLPQGTPTGADAAGGDGAGEPDLEPEHRKQIDEMYARLETLDHYALLGVPRTADRKGVKRAYFELTSRFHPDRFFRRRLGPYKLKMETVFGRMTEAHDTLTAKDRRAEYDAYLGSVEKTRSIEQMLAEAMTEMKYAEEATLREGQSPAPPPPPAPAPSPPSPSRPDSQPAVGAKPGPLPSTPNLGAFIADALEGPGPSRPPPAERISVPPIRSQPPGAKARELLARRLTGNSVRAPEAPKPPTIAFAKTGDAVDALKRRYEEKVSAARTSQARKYTKAGTDAIAKGEMVTAAQSLRVAIEFDPDNAELKTAYENAQAAADAILVEQYLKQAEYEERSERWADAGRSWSRVARTRASDAKAHDRAAHCTLKADGNLHEAAAMGQRAVQLEPKNPAFRRTLANVYLAAGLSLNAKRELEAALQLAPDDANTTALLKRIAKGS